MARPKSITPPTYRRHKARNLAVVTIDGKDHYLGPHGSPESRAEYDRLISEWLAHGRGAIETDDNNITVTELIAAYWQHVQTYYMKDGQPTGEQANIAQSMRWIKRLYGHIPAAAFGPLALKSVRARMIEDGQCRGYANKNVLRIRQLFRWAVENEIIPATVHHALQAVAGLRWGRSPARESEPVRPVPDTFVEAIRPHVSRQVWAMIELQRLTGMRPGEVVIMRGCDLDTTGEIWEYRPARHKTEHHGKERIIPLGPRAQKIVQPFLKSDLSAYLFSPADADAERRERLHANRKTPLSCGNRPGSNRKARPGRKPGDHYDVHAYRRAVERGCDLAFPPPGPLARKEKETLREWAARLTEKQHEEVKAWRKEHRWHPHQLRHNRGTELRRQFGIEAARVVLGHNSAAVTEIYAEADRALAVKIAREVG